jgi:predicted permease
MTWLSRLFSRRSFDDHLSAEMAAHLQEKIDALFASGISRAEAMRTALREFGNVTLLAERSREVWQWPSLESFLADIRFAFRTLRKSPAFAAVAILTLALGIGANATIFSIVDAVLLHALPFRDASRLVLLHEGLPKMGYPKMSFSPPDLVVFARTQKSFSELGFFQNERVDISGQGEPQRITAARISSSLFPMLGAQPMLGRTFTPQEDAPGHQLAILSYALWQSRYGGGTNILGQKIDVDRQPYTIIGVMPRSFAFPLEGPEDNSLPADLWLPMAFTPSELQEWGGSYITSVLGRLRPGVTLSQARSEASTLANIVLASYPGLLTKAIRAAQLNISASPYQEEVVGSVRTLLLVLTAAVAFVLLIACANIATLLVSRAATRRKEFAVRAALGASRLRLARQMLTESLLLALFGGALGFALAFWARDLILALVPPSISLPHEVPLNAAVLLFALGISILAAVMFGLAPAFQLSSLSVQGRLQDAATNATPSRSRHRLQGVFVIAEFALALVLLIGAGLLIRSFAALLETNPGFRPDHLLTLNIPLPRQAYYHAAQVQNFYRQLLDRVSNLPGVQSAALSNGLPLNDYEMVSASIEGRSNGEGATPEAICQSWIVGNYFQTIGVPLLQGRWFTPEDLAGSQQVAIVNLTAARQFWPGQNPIGKRLAWGVKSPWETVIGIVGDVKEGSLDTNVIPHVYRPYLQLPSFLLEQDPFNDWHAMSLSLRTQVDPASLTSAVLAQVHALDPDLAVTGIHTMTEVIRSSVAGPKFNTALLAGLAALALFLSAIGVYGVLAYMVAQQTHEIGIRLALGATRNGILRLVLIRGAKLTLAGISIGVIAALILTRLMRNLLFQVTPTDPFTFAGVTLLLMLVALAACYIPARRAMKVDPMVALRYE